MEHRGNSSITDVLRHGYEHGRGLMQCTHRHHLGSVIGDPESTWRCASRALVIYPAVGLLAKARRFSRFAPELFWQFLAASPVIYLAMLATGLGALTEWRRGRPAHSSVTAEDRVGTIAAQPRGSLEREASADSG